MDGNAPKYIVFKAEDFLKAVEAAQEGHGDQALVRLRSIALPDATVIRGQDVFAAAGLSAYANNIATALELGAVPGAKFQYLENVRDLFFERADAARANTDKKMPD